MKHSDSLTSLAPALVKAQGELKAITKDSVNPHFKATYASLDALTDAVRPILAKNGIALVQGGDSVPTGVIVETMLLHSSGEWISNSFLMPLEKSTAQGAGSAISYGRRYGLGSILALTTDEDDDGQAATPPARSAKTRPGYPPQVDAPNTKKAAAVEWATDKQIIKLIELGDGIGGKTKQTVGDAIEKGITAAKAAEWITRLAAKAAEKK